MTQSDTSSDQAKPVTRIRDPRLDFYRGLAMFIIFIAHVPANFWALWIPARFGFSDATEMFVFCSGMASAVAFGGSFRRGGWWIGSARVTFRVWQIYWAHIALFFLAATMLAAIDEFGDFQKVYIGSLNLWKFFADPGPQLIGLFTLTYVPNFFDILPMYMVLLLMMPLMMALARINLWFVAIAMALFWIFAQGRFLDLIGLGGLHIEFPAEPWSQRPWFFNPFGWQLIFFTGFAFMIGWLRPPPVNWKLITLASAIVFTFMLFSSVAIRILQFEWSRMIYSDYRILVTKTDFGILRYVHFLALAYLGWVVAGEGGHRLRIEGAGLVARIGRRIVALITKVGQQSLAVFLTSLILALLAGFVLDLVGRSGLNVLAINLTGFAALITTAYLVAWYKGQPWKKPADR
ncbi:MAG: OpgC domain-containing protein [Ahrensia sp.]|nr:OpgC domain-containing protein [Ahrensia sp.]